MWDLEVIKMINSSEIVNNSVNNVNKSKPTTIEKWREYYKSLIFNCIDKIDDSKIRGALRVFFNDIVPDYYYLIGASSSNKHHPKFASNVGGLVRHTITAFNYAIELKNNYSIFDDSINSFEFNCALAAILVHDTFKLGYVDKGKTVYSHPDIAASEFYNFICNNKSIKLDCETRDIICDCISCHMDKYGRVKPKSHVDKFVCLCDAISSKKFMEDFYDLSDVAINDGLL